MSRFTERCIFSLLCAEAQRAGYVPVYVGAPGETDGTDTTNAQEAAKAVFALDDADVTFARFGVTPDARGNYHGGFWVRLIGGNGEDFISDYGDCKAARIIIAGVTRAIEAPDALVGVAS